MKFIGTPSTLGEKSAVYGNIKYAIFVALTVGMLVICPIQIAFVSFVRALDI